MKKGWAGGSCKRQNISLPRFYSYTFCFRNAETFCCDLKCFAFSFQNSFFSFKNQPVFKWRKEKKKNLLQTGCTAPERNNLLGAEQNIWVQLRMSSSSFFIKPTFSFNKPTNQPDNLILVRVVTYFLAVFFQFHH